MIFIFCLLPYFFPWNYFYSKKGILMNWHFTRLELLLSKLFPFAYSLLSCCQNWKLPCISFQFFRDKKESLSSSSITAVHVFLLARGKQFIIFHSLYPADLIFSHAPVIPCLLLFTSYYSACRISDYTRRRAYFVRPKKNVFWCSSCLPSAFKVLLWHDAATVNGFSAQNDEEFISTLYTVLVPSRYFSTRFWRFIYGMRKLPIVVNHQAVSVFRRRMKPISE